MPQEPTHWNREGKLWTPKSDPLLSRAGHPGLGLELHVGELPVHSFTAVSSELMSFQEAERVLQLWVAHRVSILHFNPHLFIFVFIVELVIIIIIIIIIIISDWSISTPNNWCFLPGVRIRSCVRFQLPDLSLEKPASIRPSTLRLNTAVRMVRRIDFL